MTGTRWFPVLDHGSEEYRVRLRDALWGGIATLRDPDGTLRDPLVFRSREAAFMWLHRCGEVWDRHPADAPPRECGQCLSCDRRTGTPVTFDSGFSASGPGTVQRSYCPSCAIVRLSPPEISSLKRAHESACAKCRCARFCHEHVTLAQTYDDAVRISRARNLGH